MKKSFKSYLKENVENYVYKFIIKVAGEVPECCETGMKNALSKYETIKFSKLRTTPIQEKLVDFPEVSNSEVTVFEAEVQYPVTPSVLLADIVSNTKLAEANVKVRTEAEEDDVVNNVETAEKVKKDKPLLMTDYEKEPKGTPPLHGEKHKVNFLKSLAKDKDHGLTQYKGVNDQLLAKKAPKSTD